MSDNIPVQEIGEVFDTITEKLPKMLEALRSSVFSEEAGMEIASGVGSFYMRLVEKGVPEDKAMELTSSYMRTLENLGKSVDFGR